MNVFNKNLFFNGTWIGLPVLEFYCDHYFFLPSCIDHGFFFVNR